jgi:hypothetical protein
MVMGAEKALPGDGRKQRCIFRLMNTRMTYQSLRKR